MRKWTVFVLFAVFAGYAFAAEPVAIDRARSRLTVRAFKAGLFSAFAHDHEVSAPIARGELVEGDAGRVELEVDARQMVVLDPKLDADKRAEVQSTMHSAQLLDTQNYPLIRFVSTAIERRGGDSWSLTGNLTLHGVTRPVRVGVARKNGGYAGAATFKQSQFGLKPISLAGGTIKVKDQVKVEFEVFPTTVPAAAR